MATYPLPFPYQAFYQLLKRIVTREKELERETFPETLDEILKEPKDQPEFLRKNKNELLGEVLFKAVQLEKVFKAQRTEWETAQTLIALRYGGPSETLTEKLYIMNRWINELEHIAKITWETYAETINQVLREHEEYFREGDPLWTELYVMKARLSVEQEARALARQD